jgi:hypothetical protein
MSIPPTPREISFKNFNNMAKEFDLAVGEIQSTFNMMEAILKKNKSTIDERVIGFALGGAEATATFINKVALGAFTGPVTAAVTSVVTAVGGLLLLSNPARRVVLGRNTDWKGLMESDIEIKLGNNTKNVNLKDFCLDPEDTYKKAFSNVSNDQFNRLNKTIPQTSVEKIIKAGEMSKSLDNKIKASLAIGGFTAGGLFAKSIAMPISLGLSPDPSKNREDNRQQIIKPIVEDLTSVSTPRIRSKRNP